MSPLCRKTIRPCCPKDNKSLNSSQQGRGRAVCSYAPVPHRVKGRGCTPRSGLHSLALFCTQAGRSLSTDLPIPDETVGDGIRAGPRNPLESLGRISGSGNLAAWTGHGHESLVSERRAEYSDSLAAGLPSPLTPNCRTGTGRDGFFSGVAWRWCSRRWISGRPSLTDFIPSPARGRTTACVN